MDLAVLLASVSSFKSKALPAKHIVFGEVGLAGEVRPVQRGQERLREAAKLGISVDMRHALRHVECLANPSAMPGARWEHTIVPKANKPKQKIEGLEIFAVERVEQAVEYCRG